MTSSVTKLMKSGETWVPYCSAMKAWISRAAHATGVHRDDPLVEAAEAPLVLGDHSPA